LKKTALDERGKGSRHGIVNIALINLDSTSHLTGNEQRQASLSWDFEPFEQEGTELVFIGKQLNERKEEILGRLKSCEQ
jgi:hypothetical protein